MSTNSIDQIQHITSAWIDLDLDNLCTLMDNNILEMSKNNDNSVESRKSLTNITKKFKSYSDDFKVSKINEVVKAYQQEVDNLTKRAKYAEGQFLTIYKSFYKIPDPSIAFQKAVEDRSRLGKLEIELHKTSDKLQEYEIEFHKLKNQDYTVRSLEDQNRQLKTELNDTIQSLENEHTEDILRDRTICQERFSTKEKQLEDEIQRLNSELIRERESREVAETRILDIMTKYESFSVVKEREGEWTLEDLQQTKESLTQLQSEKQDLRNQIAEFYKIRDETSRDLNEQIVILKEELSSTNLLLKNEQRKRNTEKEKYESNKITLTDKIQEYENEIVSLQERPTIEAFEQLKKNLGLLRAASFQVVHRIDSKDDNISDNYEDTSEAETVLLQNNRSLQSQISVFQLEISQLKEELELSKTNRSITQEQLEKEKILVKQLETDLATVTTSNANLSGNDLVPSNNKTNSTASIQAPSTLLHSTHSVITKQRDRFRMINLQLDKQKKALENTIEKLKMEQTILKNDNLKLYEKLRYVEGYSYSRAENTNHNPNSEITTSKYKRLLEDKEHPFKSFNEVQRQQRLRELPLIERIMLCIVSFIVKKKGTRIFLAIYAVVMHIFVFVSLYTHTLNSHC